MNIPLEDKPGRFIKACRKAVLFGAIILRSTPVAYAGVE
jgi:hypothetical protein